MAGNYLSNPSTQWFDDNGDPLSGGTVDFFEAGGTSVRLDTFTDKDLTGGNENVNPVVLNADGRSPTAIFLQQISYNVVVKNSAGAVQTNASRDNVSNILQVTVTGLATILTIVALKALVKATLTDLEIRYVFGRVNKNDGAGGYFQWNESSSTTVNLGTVFASDEGSTGRWIRIQDRPLTLPMFGALGDGSNDDAGAFESAIITASTDGVDLIIPTPATSYNLATQKTISSLSGPLTIKGENLAAFTWGAASAAGRALTISDTNGNDVFISGIQFDGLTNIEEFFRVDNPSANMNDSSIGVFEIKDSLIENCFMPAGGTVGAKGFTVIGGWSEARAISITVRNMDRANGAGTPGSVGTSGFAFTHNGINQFIKKMVAIDCEIDTITNNETGAGGDNVDCDGIVMFGPDPSTNGNKPVGHVALIDRCILRDCKGRGIKTQCNVTTVRDTDFYHDLEEGISQQHDIDAQQGSLLVRGGTIFVNEKSGGGTTMGSSYVPIVGQNQGITTNQNNEEGMFHVTGVTMINSVPTSVDDSTPFFINSISAVNSRPFRSLKFTDNTLLGSRFQRFVQVDVGTDKSDIIIRGNTCELSTSLLRLATTGSFSEVNIFISENVQTGSVARTLVEDTTPFSPYISSHDNRGFTENLGDELLSSVHSEVFRPLQIGGQDRTAGGTFSIQGANLADDASKEFKTGNSAHGVGIITNTLSDKASGIFAWDGSGMNDMLGGFSTSIAYGTTSNPDTDTKLNIWFNTTNDTVNIKNRLGSTRQFSFIMMTGS